MMNRDFHLIKAFMQQKFVHKQYCQVPAVPSLQCFSTCILLIDKSFCEIEKSFICTTLFEYVNEGKVKVLSLAYVKLRTWPLGRDLDRSWCHHW